MLTIAADQIPPDIANTPIWALLTLTATTWAIAWWAGHTTRRQDPHHDRRA